MCFQRTCNPITSDQSEQVQWFYTNVRGLRQGSGEIRATAACRKSQFVGLVETHLDGDPIRPLGPAGYKTVGRLVRSKQGGGLIVLARSHLLVDKVDLSAYHIEKAAEMIGIQFQDTAYILCYTPSAAKAPQLFNSLTKYMLDHQDQCTVCIGDFNSHNPDWLMSSSPLDTAGMEAQQFA